MGIQRKAVIGAMALLPLAGCMPMQALKAPTTMPASPPPPPPPPPSPPPPPVAPQPTPESPPAEAMPAPSPNTGAHIPVRIPHRGRHASTALSGHAPALAPTTAEPESASPQSACFVYLKRESLAFGNDDATRGLTSYATLALGPRASSCPLARERLRSALGNTADPNGDPAMAEAFFTAPAKIVAHLSANAPVLLKIAKVEAGDDEAKAMPTSPDGVLRWRWNLVPSVGTCKTQVQAMQIDLTDGSPGGQAVAGPLDQQITITSSAMGCGEGLARFLAAIKHYWIEEVLGGTAVLLTSAIATVRSLRDRALELLRLLGLYKGGAGG